MTQGRRSLLAVASKLSREEIAIRCHVSVSAVKNWCSGLREPSKIARASLEREFGIHCDSWALPRCHRVQR